VQEARGKKETQARERLQRRGKKENKQKKDSLNNRSRGGVLVDVWLITPMVDLKRGVEEC